MEISFYDHWIKNGSNFADGVAFYRQHGTNESFKKLLASETMYTRTKLAFELKQVGNISFKEVEIPGEFKTYRESKKRLDPETLPEALKKEYFRLGPIWAETRFLHSRLDILQTEKERCAHALSIIDNSEKRREIFNRIDYFMANGKDLPQMQNMAPVEEIPHENNTDSPELKQYKLKSELLRLRVQRSKLKKQPHRQADLNKTIEKLKDVETQLSQLVGA